MYKDYTNFCLGIECVNSHWKGDRSGAGVMYKRLPPAASCPKKVAPGLKPQNFPFWPHFIYGLPPYTHPLRQPASSRVFQNAQLCLATIHRKPLPPNSPTQGALLSPSESTNSPGRNLSLFCKKNWLLT